MKKKFSRDRLKAADEANIFGQVKASGQGVINEEEELSSLLFVDDEDEDDFTSPSEPMPELTEVKSGWEEGGLFVTSSEAGQRLDKFLAVRCPEFSRSQLTRLARDGEVLVDGQPMKASALVSAGQHLTFPMPQSPITNMEPDPEVILSVVYEDEYILVLNKPDNLVVHPAPGYHGPTLVGGLLAYNPQLSEVGERFRPGLVHRLDRDTSGLIITAKTEPALRILAEGFSSQHPLKKYLAFVRGCPQARSGLIDRPLGRHLTQRHKMAVDVPRGKPSRTRYQLIRHFPKANISLVMLTLITGRTHQIRVHLQSMGTPVLADPVYSRGVTDLIKLFPQFAPYLNRQLLHARRLSIKHPITGELQTFWAPWPREFKGLLAELMALEEG